MSRVVPNRLKKTDDVFITLVFVLLDNSTIQQRRKKTVCFDWYEMAPIRFVIHQEDRGSVGWGERLLEFGKIIQCV